MCIYIYTSAKLTRPPPPPPPFSYVVADANAPTFALPGSGRLTEAFAVADVDQCWDAKVAW